MSNTKRTKARKKCAGRNSKSSAVLKANSDTSALSNLSQARDNEIFGHILEVAAELKFQHEVSINKENFYMQDNIMKIFFEYFPEFVCIDVLCEIYEISRKLILLIGVDSNAHCEIISIGLIKCEDLQGFQFILNTFKKNNSSWGDIKLILSDQSCDSNILKAAFPEKAIFTSFFHSMKAFKKDISTLSNVVTEEDIKKTLQLFEKMMFETSEKGYGDLLKEMKQMNAQIFNLFNKKWHVKRDTWALGLLTDSKTFLKTLNLYMLSIRRQLKPIICSAETFESVVRNLHSSIYKLRKEWFQHITKMFHSPAAPHLKIPIMQKYCSLLTPFASELLYEQLKKSNNIQNIEKFHLQSYYKVDETLATSFSCSCSFYKFMKLPCCHILSLRKHLLLPQFVQSVRPSWIHSNYSDVYIKLYSAHIFDHEESRAAEICSRFQEYIRICFELWSKIFNCSEKESQERLEVFQNIVKAWKSDFGVAVMSSEKPKMSENTSQSIEDLPNDEFTEWYGISLDDIINSENVFMDIALAPDDTIDVF